MLPLVGASRGPLSHLVLALCFWRLAEKSDCPKCRLRRLLQHFGSAGGFSSSASIHVRIYSSSHCYSQYHEIRAGSSLRRDHL